MTMNPMAEQPEEEFGHAAFAALEVGAPWLDPDAIWQRVAPGISATLHSGATDRRRWWSVFALPSMPAMSRRAGLVAAGAAVIGAVAVGTLSSGGDRASAALLESARLLSVEADVAFQDGSLSEAELIRLRTDAERILEAIRRDPSSLRALDSEDLGALTQVLSALEDRLRTSGASAAALPPLESAVDLASDALRVAAPTHPALTATRDRDAQTIAASPGARTLTVGDAGTVDIDVQAGSLMVVRFAPAPGWVTETERAAGRELEIEFVRNSDGRSLRLHVELEDGQLRTRVDELAGSAAAPPAAGTAQADDSPTAVSSHSGPSEEQRERTETFAPAPAAGGTSTFTAANAGTATVTFDGGGLTLAGASPSAGWTFEVEQRSGRELEVHFHSAAGEVRLKAELENGEVRVRVETRAAPTSTPSASTSGPSATSGPSGSSGSSGPSGSSGSSGDGSRSGSSSSGSGSSGSGGGDDGPGDSSGPGSGDGDDPPGDDHGGGD